MQTRGFGKVLQDIVAARFGPGALGRIGTVARAAIAGLCVLGIVTAFINPYITAGCALLLFVIVLDFFRRAFKYADDHPEYAAMDGTQIQKHLASQGMKALEGLPPIPDYIDVTVENPLIEERKG
jgi:hypothetical protein